MCVFIYRSLCSGTECSIIYRNVIAFVNHGILIMKTKALFAFILKCSWTTYRPTPAPLSDFLSSSMRLAGSNGPYADTLAAWRDVDACRFAFGINDTFGLQVC